MELPETTNLLTPTCFVCHQRGTVSVLTDDLRRYQEGALVQSAFPELTADLREQVINGTHPACWDKVFGTDEGED
jgi:hypothetical protein